MIIVSQDGTFNVRSELCTKTGIYEDEGKKQWVIYADVVADIYDDVLLASFKTKEAALREYDNMTRAEGFSRAIYRIAKDGDVHEND